LHPNYDPTHERPFSQAFPAYQHPFPSNLELEQGPLTSNQDQYLSNHTNNPITQDPFSRSQRRNSNASSTSLISFDEPQTEEERKKEAEDEAKEEFLMNELLHGRGKDILTTSTVNDWPPESHIRPEAPALPKKEKLDSQQDKRDGGKSLAPEQVSMASSSQQPSADVLSVIPQETYQIKHIRYVEPDGNKLKRASILLQNENGPCPLISLVNALSLSRETLVLTEALRIREQLSLELLLGVVCEELVLSGSWEGDLSELHRFLLDLRKGMNVNPKFIGDEITAEDFLHNSNLQENRPLPQPRPGSFVHTREMELYNAFNIPLVHGWLPAPTSAWFPTLINHARNFEQAQDLILQQQFIIERVSAGGAEMSSEDNLIVSNASEIQLFLDASATQCTTYGLGVLAQSLKPGSWSIFFRNDHFGVLYKHLTTGTLYTLVTDAGYSSYEEIVWESLVDATGRGGAYFSGDFRSVSHAGAQPTTTTSAGLGDNEGWQTVTGRNSRQQGPQSSLDERVSSTPSLPPRTDTGSFIPPDTTGDTTDYDLALALHLQQEEDEEAERQQRQRRASAARTAGNLMTGGGNVSTPNRPLVNTSNYSAPRQPPRPSGNRIVSARYEPPPPPSNPVPVPEPIVRERNPEDVDPPPRYERVQSSGPASPVVYAQSPGGTMPRQNPGGPTAYSAMSSQHGTGPRRHAPSGSAGGPNQNYGQQQDDRDKCSVM